MNDNQRLRRSDLFDFTKWTYNVLREDVEGDFFEKLFCGKDYKKTRYWISAVRKGPYVETRYMTILCYKSYDDKRDFYFRSPEYMTPCDIVKYWYNSQEPIDIIQHLRAKLDITTLPENLIFSSDDI
jgi:hypothetical protein